MSEIVEVFGREVLDSRGNPTVEAEVILASGALSKIAGLKMCAYYNRQYGARYISVMPCNLYGINDNFALENSHVLPALIRKFHEAKEQGAPSVTVWGSGTPLREFLNVDDLADACLFLMDHYEGEEFFNVGSGRDRKSVV